MRIILLDSEARYLSETPLALTPLLGKPLLERVCEYWLKRGATRFDIVLSDSSRELQERLGEGEKWGVHLSYHSTLNTIEMGEDRVVVGRLESFPPPSGLTELPCVTVSPDQQWTGWAFAPQSAVQRLVQGHLPYDLQQVYHPARAIGSRDSFLSLQLFMLREGCVEAREETPGIWVAPGAVIHPTARLSPPLYIGKNSIIDADVSLGPAVVVDRNCLVARGCDLVDCWVQPRAAVRPGRKATGEFIAKNSVSDGLKRFIRRIAKFTTLVWGSQNGPDISKAS